MTLDPNSLTVRKGHGAGGKPRGGLTMAFYGGDANDVQNNNANFHQYGGNGDDYLRRDNGSFEAYGGSGNDLLWVVGPYYMDAFGGYGNDWILFYGGTGSYLYGDVGQDLIQAGNGNDL